MARRRVLPDLVARLRLDATGFDNRLKRVEGSLAGLRTNADRTGGAFATLSTRIGGLRAGFVGLGAAGAALAGGGGLAAIFKGSVDAASDLNETVSKSQQVFGASQQAVANFAQTAANSIGQSRQAALEAASTFGSLFAGMGIGEKQSADFSIQLTRLASDFASFSNANPAAVVESLTAAFRGEYDSLQRYVPTINAAAVEQKALALGLARSTKEVSAQDKAIATYQYVLDNAGAAAGDFQRTSEGLANQQRILAANFADAKAQLGQDLLPTMTSFVQFLNREGVPALERFGGAWRAAFDQDPKTKTKAPFLEDLAGIAALPKNLQSVERQFDALSKEGGSVDQFRRKLGFTFNLLREGVGPTAAREARPAREAQPRNDVPDSILDRLGDLTKARNTLGTSTETLIRRQQVLATSTARTAEQDEKAANAAERLRDARRSLEQAQRRVADADFDVADAQDDVREAEFRQGVGSEEAIKARRALDRAKLGAADARADVADRGDAVAKANKAVQDTLPMAVDNFTVAVGTFSAAVMAWLNGAGIKANAADTGNLLGAGTTNNFHINGITDVPALSAEINRELDWTNRSAAVARAGRGGRPRV